MEPVKVLSQMKASKSVCACWNLKNWKECHHLLAAEAECVVEIADYAIRFFLRPTERTVVAQNCTTINEWYSLCVQLQSPHNKLSLKITVKEESFGLTEDCQIYLTRTATNPNAIENVATEFLLFARMCVDVTTGKRRERDKMFFPTHADIDELKISITVTMLELNQTQSPQKIDASAEMKATSCDATGEALPSNISMLLEANERKLFSDVKLQMNDGIVLFGHKLILAGSSPVFETMFTSEMQESQSNVVTIPDISSNEMKIIMKYIYTRLLDASWPGRVQEVVHAAHKYQVHDLINRIDKMLISICNPNNAVLLLKLAKTYNLFNAIADLTEYSKIHTTEILINQLDSL